MPRHFGCVSGYIYPNKEYADGETLDENARYCNSCRQHRPESWFVDDRNGGYFKTCRKCREYKRRQVWQRRHVGN